MLSIIKHGLSPSQVVHGVSKINLVNKKNSSIITYLFVAQSRNSVNVLLLDHECCQVGCVTGQEDDSEEGPYQHHDLTRGALWVLNRHRIVEDNPPKQPH